jgi:hypothetical protein
MTMILTTLLAATSLFGGPTPVQARPGTSEDTAEGAEILRRILVDALDDTFARKSKDDGDTKTRVRQLGQLDRLGVVTTLWTDRETVQHSRVFHLPEVGLFFALDAALPVVSREEEEEKGAADKSDKARDDEWESARRAVRGGLEGSVFVTRHRTSRASEIDPRAIDQAIDQVLRTVARHVGRIEGLASRETVTVALRLSGRERTVWSGHDWIYGDDDDREAELETRVEDGRDAPEAFSFVLAGGTSAREQKLVIRIGLADLAGFADGGSIESLRQRAQINRY